MLGADAATEFWDDRHRSTTRFRSGGNAGMDEGANEILYALRLARLIEIIGDLADPAAPMQLLDAGCGKGWFSHAMARFGHRVDGIDVSRHAIATCRDAAGPRERYAVSTLAEWRPDHLYDVVYSIDVLFHVMDDDEWEASLLNLARHVRWGGLLVVAERDSDEDRTWSSYQRTRALSRYRAVLGHRGLRDEGFVPNGFRDGDVGFAVFRRVA